MDSVRIDKWLWAARFFKTRSLATDEVNKGHVQIAKQNIKPSREVRVGDLLTVWQAKIPRTISAQTALAHAWLCKNTGACTPNRPMP